MEASQASSDGVSITIHQTHRNEHQQKCKINHTLKGVLGCIGGLFIHIIISSLYQWGAINIYVTSYYKYTDDQSLTLENNAVIFPAMMICIGVTMRGGLFLSKKIGPIPVLAATNILSASCVFISSYMPNFYGFIAFYGILFGLFVGSSFMIPIVQCNKYFPTKKMYVNGCILVGTGLGSVIFSTFSYDFINENHLQPINGYYLNQIALRVPECLRFLSLMYLVIGGIGTLLLVPVIRYNQEYAKSHKVIEIGEHEAESICQAVFSLIFWKKILVLILATCGVFLITGNYKTYVKEEIHDDGFLTLIGAVGAIGNGCSRFIWSIIFNKTGYKFVMTCNILLLLIVLGTIRFAVLQSHQAYLFLVFVANCCLGGYLVITPIFSQLVFGQTTGSNIYGFFWSTYSIANFVQYAYISTLVELISFDNVIYICMGMCVLALPVIIFSTWQGPWNNSIMSLEYCQGSGHNHVSNEPEAELSAQYNMEESITQTAKKRQDDSQDSGHSLKIKKSPREQKTNLNTQNKLIMRRFAWQKIFNELVNDYFLYFNLYIIVKNLLLKLQNINSNFKKGKAKEMFDGIQLNLDEESPEAQYWKNITPKKRRNMQCEKSTKEMDDGAPILTRKKSVLDDLQFIAPLRRQKSIRNHLRRFSVSEWNQDSLCKDFQANYCIMQKDDCDPKIQEQQSEQIPHPSRLYKKMTMIDRNIEELGLKLYKNNSTIQVDQKIIETDEGKYGDNIFIQQITSLERGLSRKQSYIGNYQYQNMENDEDTERLLRDYQITSSINAYVKHHQNYLCLNKIQRIFYYVKKITYSNQFAESDVHELCNQQIMTYHRDQDDRMLRFYQSWIEEDCIYLIFQTASFSLQEKTEQNIKFRENQIWSMLTDCCHALLWLKNSEKQFHLNIKPGNILKCRDRYKLSDPLINIGHLKKVLQMLEVQENSSDLMKFTFAYAAPEIIQYRKLLNGLNMHKCDIYSLGMCILENIMNIPISIMITNAKSIRKNHENFLKGYSPALRNLLMRMIHFDPVKRPNASEIVMLPNLDSVDLKKKKPIQRKFSL